MAAMAVPLENMKGQVGEKIILEKDLLYEVTRTFLSVRLFVCIQAAYNFFLWFSLIFNCKTPTIVGSWAAYTLHKQNKSDGT